MNTLEEQKKLSKSLLAACKAAGIKESKYIAQDEDGQVVHHEERPTREGWTHIFGGGGACTSLDHPPYADDWQDSLLEFVEPQGEPLADVLARHPDHVADVSKMIADEARKLGYRKMIAEYAGRRTEALVYERAWQDALAWKGVASE